MEKKEIPVTDGDAQEELNVNEVEETQEQEATVTDDAATAETSTGNVENTEELSEEDMKKVAVEKVAAELAEMKDKYLRLYAEFDNYRKRTLREKDTLIKTAAANTINSLLPTLDDFERAIKAADATDNDETVSDGIRLVYEKMLKTLEQRGLKAMESTGEAFDPDLHEALTKVPAPTEDMKGKVIDTIEKGYYLNDKIIRYAKVVVGQ